MFSPWSGDEHVVWIILELIFATFSTLNSDSVKVYIQGATPYTISYRSLCNFANLCLWFGVNPAVNFAA